MIKRFTKWLLCSFEFFLNHILLLSNQKLSIFSSESYLRNESFINDSFVMFASGKSGKQESKKTKVSKPKSKDENEKTIESLEVKLSENNQLLETMKREIERITNVIKEASKTPEEVNAENKKKRMEDEIKSEITNLESKLKFLETSTLDQFHSMKDEGGKDSLPRQQEGNIWDRKNFESTGGNVFDPYERSEMKLNAYDEYNNKVRELKSQFPSQEEIFKRFRIHSPSSSSNQGQSNRGNSNVQDTRKSEYLNKADILNKSANYERQPVSREDRDTFKDEHQERIDSFMSYGSKKTLSNIYNTEEISLKNKKNQKNKKLFSDIVDTDVADTLKFTLELPQKDINNKKQKVRGQLNFNDRRAFAKNELEQVQDQILKDRYEAKKAKPESSFPGDVTRISNLEYNNGKNPTNIMKKTPLSKHEEYSEEDSKISDLKGIDTNVNFKNSIGKKRDSSKNNPEENEKAALSEYLDNGRRSSDNGTLAFNANDLKADSYEQGLRTPESVRRKSKSKNSSHLSFDEQMQEISKEVIVRDTKNKQDTLESLLANISRNKSNLKKELNQSYDNDLYEDFGFEIGNKSDVIIPVNEKGIVDFDQIELSIEDLETKAVGKNTKPAKDNNWTKFQNEYLSSATEIEDESNAAPVSKAEIAQPKQISVVREEVPTPNYDREENSPSSNYVNKLVSGLNAENDVDKDYDTSDLRETIESLRSFRTEKSSKRKISLPENKSLHNKNNVYDTFETKTFKRSDIKVPKVKKEVTVNSIEDPIKTSIKRNSKVLSADQVVKFLSNGQKMKNQDEFSHDDFKKFETYFPGESGREIRKVKNKEFSLKPEFYNKKPTNKKDENIRVGKDISPPKVEPKPSRRGFVSKKKSRKVEPAQQAPRENNQKLVSKPSSLDVETRLLNVHESSELNGFSFNKPINFRAGKVPATKEQKIQSNLYRSEAINEKVKPRNSNDMKNVENYGLDLKKVELNPFYKVND